jgi:ParB family chromosome partitioning protein
VECCIVAARLDYVPVSAIRENREMLRGCNKQTEEYQNGLASVREKGILTPISVRDLGDGTFGLIDGLQRWNWAQDAGLPTIPAQITDTAEAEVLEAQIVANVQRIETKPVEYTKALLKLLAMNPTLTMTELARRLGKGTGWLNDRFHLLKLKDSIQALVNEGKIPLANAYALSKVPTEHQDQFLVNAQTQPTGEFVPAVQKFVKEIKDAARQGRSVDTNAFMVVPHLQKISDIKGELENSKVADILLSNTNTTDPKEAFLLGLKWALHLDPLSIDAAKQKFEARKVEAEAAKKKRAEERAAKKEAEAKQQLAAAA